MLFHAFGDGGGGGGGVGGMSFVRCLHTITGSQVAGVVHIGYVEIVGRFIGVVFK